MFLESTEGQARLAWQRKTLESRALGTWTWIKCENSDSRDVPTQALGPWARFQAPVQLGFGDQAAASMSEELALALRTTGGP